MLTKRLSTSLFALLLFSVSLYGFNYFQLYKIQSTLLTALNDSPHGGLKVKNVQKVVLNNQLDMTLQHQDKLFTISVYPSYLSDDIPFTISKASEGYVSDQIGLKTTFDYIEGNVNRAKSLLTLHYHNLKLHNLPSLEYEASVTPQKTHYISAQKNTFILRYSSFASLFGAASNTPPEILTYQIDELNVDGSFSAKKVRWDTEDSTLKTINYNLLIQELKDIDSRVLTKVCMAAFNNSEDPSLNCNQDVFSQVFPLNVDLYGKIDNAIIKGRPTNGSGTMHLLATNPVINYQLKGEATQSPRELQLKMQYETVVTDKMRLQKLYKVIDPDNTYNHTLAKEKASFELHTDPFTYSPVAITFGLKSIYEYANEISTISLNLDKNKSRYYIYRDAAQDIELADLEYVGTANIGHKSLLKPMSELLGFEIEPNTIIDTYQEK